MVNNICEKTIFERGIIFRNHSLICENNFITEIVSNQGTHIDCKVVTNGFTDLQVNGGGGVLLNAMPNNIGVLKTYDWSIVRAH